jgi:hypothetical protein
MAEETEPIAEVSLDIKMPDGRSFSCKSGVIFRDDIKRFREEVRLAADTMTHSFKRWKEDQGR